MFKEWIKNFFAISEVRTSTLIIILLTFVGCAIWQLSHISFDISENIKTIIINLIYIVGGVNITNIGSDALKYYINYKSTDNKTNIETGDG